MACARTAEVSCYFDGELGPSEVSGFRDHLADCRSCQTALTGAMQLEVMAGEYLRGRQRENLVVALVLVVLLLVAVAGMVVVPGWVLESPVETWVGEGKGEGRSSAGTPELGGAGVFRAGGGR